MSIEDLKREIEARTGIPAPLLTGETAEENISQAKAFLAYKREYDATRPKSARDKFAEWAAAELGTATPQDNITAALTELEEQIIR